MKKRKHDLLPKCFGKNKNGGCSVVDGDIKCDKTTCPFYKTELQAAASREKGDIRLRSLSAEAQAYIAAKYYDGKMPWLDTETDPCLTNQNDPAAGRAALN